MKGKKKIRQAFRNSVYKRDKYTCRTCGFRSSEVLAQEELDAHHITDRNEMPNGGYVKENGISLCAGCHLKAEQYHQTQGESWHSGMHPDDLYALIGSSWVLAVSKSHDLS